MKIADSLIDIIGNTPLVRLSRFVPDLNIYAKCEFLNPFSVKDRPVLQIITDAEERGELNPGSTLLEATSGNTGMAVAYIAAIKGYRAILVMSESQSLERRQVLKALGAELVLTPAAEGTAGAKRKLNAILAENPDYFYVGQHVNPSNPKSHYLTTGPELWADTDGQIDILVGGLGTGGTLCGAGKYIKERKPALQVIGVEPKESPYISQGIFRPHRLMGTAPGFVPETLDREQIDEIFLVSEDEAFVTCRELARSDGMLVGISSGAAAYAARAVAQRPENAGKMIAVVFADSGQRYLSVDGLFV